MSIFNIYKKSEKYKKILYNEEEKQLFRDIHHIFHYNDNCNIKIYVNQLYLQLNEQQKEVLTLLILKFIDINLIYKMEFNDDGNDVIQAYFGMQSLGDKCKQN
jgi:hypothetical protein